MTAEQSCETSCSVYSKKKVKLSLQQALEAHKVVTRRGSHIF
jgi:hypothetical protein